MEAENHPEVRLEQALALHREGRADEARALYEGILAEVPGHPKALLNMASLDLDVGALQDCIDRCLTVLEAGEKDPAAELLVARAYFLTNQHDLGYTHMARAFSLAPHDPGIAYEFTAALRRRYWTHRGDEYAELLEQAQNNALPLSKLPRFVHQSLAKIIRPEYIKLLVRGPQEGEPDIPLIEVWMGKLPEQSANELEVLARNFHAALTTMHRQPEFRAHPARVGMRDGTVVETQEFLDLDPITLGSFEYITQEGELRFEALANIQQIRFGAPGAAIDCEITLRDGRTLDGFMPLFYVLSEFSQSESVRDGRSTLLRTIMEGVRVPIGLRQWQIGEQMVPALGVSWIELDPTPEDPPAA